MKPIVLLGEAMGANEVRIGAGFVGSAGVELLRMLDEAEVIALSAEDHSYISRFYKEGDPTLLDCVWQMHPEVRRMNVFNLHPPGNDLGNFCGAKADAIPNYPPLQKSKYLHKDYAGELARLGDDLLAVDPNLVVCLGNTALWALAGTTGISKLRGTTRLSSHIVSGFKLLPTYHPASILRQWENRPTTIADLMKAKREAAYPEIRRPVREIWIEPTLEDIREFIERYIRGCELLSVDIETAGNQVTCIGLSPDAVRSLVVPFFDKRAKGNSYWPTKDAERTAWTLLASVLGDRTIPKLYQNGLYDIAFKLRSLGIKVYGAEHDTMLLHHALQPESLKGLGFLGSIYSDEGAWKQERKGTTTIKRDE